MKHVEVLLAEDNEGDILLVEEALGFHDVEYRLHVARDGSAISRYLERLGHTEDAPRPDVILLDLNLPKGDGHEVPERLSFTTDVFNDSDHNHHLVGRAEDRQLPELRGASVYFRKPLDISMSMTLGGIVRDSITAKKTKDALQP
jgi:CheY-like chemotaxis protein